MRTKHLLKNARSASEAARAVTTARAQGWNDAAIERHGSVQVRKVVRTLAAKLVTPVPALVVKPAPKRTIAAGRALSERDKARLAEASKYPIGTRTGAELLSMGPAGATSHGNARVEVEQHGPAGGLTVAIEAPGAQGYAKISPAAFGQLKATGGAVTVHLFTDRACQHRVGEYKLVKQEV